MESVKAFLEDWDILGLRIGAVISLIVGLIYTGIMNLVTMKSRPYNISCQTVNRTVYDNRQEGDFFITVSYKASVYEELSHNGSRGVSAAEGGLGDGSGGEMKSEKLKSILKGIWAFFLLCLCRKEDQRISGRDGV